MAKYEPVLMPLEALVDYTAVARQVQTLIHSKLSTLKTVCLDLASEPQPPQRTGQHQFYIMIQAARHQTCKAMVVDPKYPTLKPRFTSFGNILVLILYCEC
jgi:hypothetical protein